MEKIYQFKKTFIIFLSSLCSMGIIVLFLNYKDAYIHPIRFWLGMLSLVIVLLSFPEILTKKIILKNSDISEKNKPLIKFYREAIKELKWDEVGYIVDDYVSPILFYPPYKLHIFHIMPKDYIIKPFKRISISWWIKDYQELLKEVIENVGSDVVIEDYIFEFLKRYEEKKLKRKKKQ